MSNLLSKRWLLRFRSRYSTARYLLTSSRIAKQSAALENMLRQSLLRLLNVSQLPQNAQTSIAALPQLLSRRNPLRHCSASATSQPAPAVKRLSQIISLSGLCSRRQAEKLIRDGQVTVDGEKITAPAAVVAPDAKIAVDGQLVKFAATAQPRPRMWMINKLRGELVTDSDERGRASIMDRIKKMGFAKGKHLKPVVSAMR
jgi:hypothetical protein